MLIHYYSLSNPGYHFVTVVAGTRRVRIKMVLVSAGRSFNMQSSTNERKFGLIESAGLVVSILPLPLQITDVCTRLRPWKPNAGTRAQHSYVWRGTTSKEEKSVKNGSVGCSDGWWLSNPDRSPGRPLMLKWKYFYHLALYLINYY